MLEHALTEYYVSICFVNLLYSNCSLPEVNDEIKSVHIHLLKLNWIHFKCYVEESFIFFKNKNQIFSLFVVILAHVWKEKEEKRQLVHL